MVDKKFEEKFKKLDNLLRDPESEFSGSKMYEDLSSLEAPAMAFGQNSSQLANLYDDLSLLQSKRGDYEETLSFGEKALTIHKQINCFDDERIFLLHYRLFKAHEEESQSEEALNYLKFCIEKINSPWLNDIQRLGMRQDFGKILHDLKLFQEALESNLSCYQDACAVLGEENTEADGLINNIVQNYYELKKFDEAESWLNKRLKLAQANGSYDEEANSLFQLGVLKFERGDSATAFKLFDQRLTRAKELDMDHLIEGAQEAIEELKTRLKK